MIKRRTVGVAYGDGFTSAGSGGCLPEAKG